MARNTNLAPIETKSTLTLSALGDSLTFKIDGADVVQNYLDIQNGAAWPAGCIISVTVALFGADFDDFLDGAVTYTGVGLQDELVVTRMAMLKLKVTALGAASGEVCKVTGRASFDA